MVASKLVTFYMVPIKEMSLPAAGSGVIHKGCLQRGGRGRVGLDVDKCRQGGAAGVDCMRTSATQLYTKACRAGMCSCMVILVTPTVTALALLNGPLRLLDVCCQWLLGLWHGAHTSVKGESA